MKTWFISFTVIIIGFFGMMRMKSDVTTLDRERHMLINQQYQLQERIRILNADIALLKNPARLNTIAEKAGFKEMSPTQFLTIQPLSPKTEG